jgi:AcrR family transcriptional regulator
MLKQNNYKARVPQQERGINTKERIVIAAEKLFIEYGYHDTNSKQIARDAGISIGSFYSYFKDKRDVLIVIVMERIRHTVAAMKEYLDREDRSHTVKEVAAALIVLAKENLSPELFREVTILRYHDPVINNLQENTIQSVSEVLMPWIQSLGSQLRITDLEAGIEMLIMSIMDVVHATTIYNKKIKQERMFNELIDMVNRYLVGDS